MHSVNKISYGSLEQSVEMMAQIFQGLFFDSVDQKVNGLLVLDNRLEYIAGNERGKEICKTLFPAFGGADASCIRTAKLIRQNYQIGCFRFDMESRNSKQVFDFSLFPKSLGEDGNLDCYLCTVADKNADAVTGFCSSRYYGLLTRRQIEVVELMAAGKSNREIAEILVISEHTVHKHLENIRSRLGVNNKVGILNKLNLMYA